MTTTARRATVNVLSDTEIEILREFDAPAKLVFAAWSKPEYMARWYGPRAMTMSRCEIDFRPGGRYQWWLKTPDGQEFTWRGEYREISKYDRMVSTESFLLGDMWTNELVNHVSFEEVDGKTRVRNRVVYASRQDRDGHLGAGMEGGMNETFDRLDAFLADEGFQAAEG